MKQIQSKEVREVLREAESILGLCCEAIPIEAYRQGTKAVGAYRFRETAGRIDPVSFVFCREILEGYWPRDVIRSVVFHEYAHFYANASDQKNHHHDAVFRSVCHRLGISSKATVPVPARRHQPAYLLRCSVCNKKVAERIRKDSALRLLKTHQSTCCRAPLTLEVRRGRPMTKKNLLEE
ncbi:hypothetical protein ABB02_01751 [Clostridiaceae bacterium JG1575]|nr:hypothetical protein ABB02_01751 [Clostridiaceae bacterium JG1575]